MQWQPPRQEADWLRTACAQVGRLAPGAGGFLGWWGRIAGRWLPMRVRRRARPRPRSPAAADRTTRPCSCGCSRATSLHDLGRDAGGRAASTPPTIRWRRCCGPRLADLPRWLLLPAAAGLRRRLALPAAAADRLRDVVGFEIDRQTPFTADAVAFDARVLGRRDSDGQLDAELVVVPRAGAGSAAGRARPAGADACRHRRRRQRRRAAGGQPAGPAQRRRQRRSVALLEPRAGRRRRCSPLPRAMWQLLDNRRAAADDLEQTHRAPCRRRPRRAATQRQRLIDLIEGQAFLDRTRAAAPDRGGGDRRTHPPPARQHLSGKAGDRGRTPDPDRPQPRGARR